MALNRGRLPFNDNALLNVNLATKINLISKLTSLLKLAYYFIMVVKLSNLVKVVRHKLESQVCLNACYVL